MTTDIFKKNYTLLADAHKKRILDIKTKCEELYALLDTVYNREMSIAKTKLEECSMWATKSIVLEHDLGKDLK